MKKSKFARNMSKEDLQRVKDATKAELAPLIDIQIDSAYNIKIVNDTISYIAHGSVVKSRQLDIPKLVDKVRHIAFPSLGSDYFNSHDVLYSPLEADRNARAHLWRKKFQNIDFAKGMPIVLITLLETGNFPTFIDFLMLYVGVYMEPVKPGEEMNATLRKAAFTNGASVDDRTNLGNNMYYSDGTCVKNILVRFKDEFNKKTYAFNEFPLEMIANRLRKAFPSFIRDILLGMQASQQEKEFGRDTKIVYNMVEDLKGGVDLFFDDNKILGSTCTESSIEFNKKKAENEKARHPKLKEDPYVLRVCAEIPKSSGIKVIGKGRLAALCQILSSKDYAQFDTFVY